ncbi:TPA: hypothetical protein QDZ84_003471 [Shewanella algae]|uniref:hypothetical protein n=1 Tax=Shewanella TaxID=22 RepID=UPI0014317B86|nr:MULTISPECIES: hypothetical protein [Shewanella]NJI86937.1 hypothetical protein [Shewanella sp. Iso12]HDS1208432.1 hypothetical protein [Shewanella algae]
MNEHFIKSFQKEMPGDVVSALVAVLNAKAYVELIHPVSNAIVKEALAKFQPLVADGECGRALGAVGKPINDWDFIHLANDDVAKSIHDYYLRRMAEEGFSSKNSQKCPLLVAESTVMECESLLIDVMEQYTNMSNADLCLIEHRRSYLELTLNFLVPLASVQKIELNVLNR